MTGSGPGEPIRGFRRRDGRIGLRNLILVVSLLDLVNDVASRIADAVPQAVALLSPMGGLGFGEEAALLSRLRLRLAANPNVAAILAVAPLAAPAQAFLGEVEDGAPRRAIVLAEHRDSARAVAAGIAEARELARDLRRLRRLPCGLGALRLALRSSLSSRSSQRLVNPAVGTLVDRVIEAGGSVAFSELADLAAVADLVVARAATSAVADAAEAAFAATRRTLAALGSLAPDPTPMNRSGGIATLHAKGRGALRRLGSAPLASVLAYGEDASAPGLHMIDGPGSAAVSLVGLAAAGCTALVYTVGTSSIVASMPLMASLRLGPLELSGSRDLDLVVAPGDARAGAALETLLCRTASGRPSAGERGAVRSLMLPNFLPAL
jgi:altronate dehydratase large subunit